MSIGLQDCGLSYGMVHPDLATRVALSEPENHVLVGAQRTATLASAAGRLLATFRPRVTNGQFSIVRSNCKNNLSSLRRLSLLR